MRSLVIQPPASRSSSKLPSSSCQAHQSGTHDDHNIDLPRFKAINAGRLGAREATLTSRFWLRSSISRRGLREHAKSCHWENGTAQNIVPSEQTQVHLTNQVTLHGQFRQRFQLLQSIQARDPVAICPELSQVSETLQLWLTPINSSVPIFPTIRCVPATYESVSRYRYC